MVNKFVPNKSGFIRKFDLKVSPQEVIDAAKAEGFEIDTKYISVVRSLMRKEARERKAKPAKPSTNGAAKHERKKDAPAPHEVKLKAIAFAIGIERALELLQEESDIIHKMLGEKR